MFSRPLRYLSLGSLLLMLLVMVLWTRSFGWRDAWHFKWHDRRWELISDKGNITLDDVPQHAFEYWAVQHKKEALDAQATSEIEKLLQKNEIDADKWNYAESLRQSANGTEPPPPYTDFDHGFMATHDYRSYSISFAIPMALVTLLPAIQLLRLIAALPVMIVRKNTFRARVAKGLCVKCSYDLRGSPSPNCPECGSPVVRRTMIAARESV